MIRSAAEILREYGPFPGVDHVHGVTFDGQHVWFASRDELNAFDPASGKTVRSIPPSSSSRAGCPSPATRPVRALRCGRTLAGGGRGGRWKRPCDFPILRWPCVWRRASLNGRRLIRRTRWRGTAGGGGRAILPAA